MLCRLEERGKSNSRLVSFSPLFPPGKDSMDALPSMSLCFLFLAGVSSCILSPVDSPHIKTWLLQVWYSPLYCFVMLIGSEWEFTWHWKDKYRSGMSCYRDPFLGHFNQWLVQLLHCLKIIHIFQTSKYAFSWALYSNIMCGLEEHNVVQHAIQNK